MVVEALDLLSHLAASKAVNANGFRTPLPFSINGDPVQLQQVLINLIVNAMDALSNRRLANVR